ncbi:MAG: lytic transglycosylase domain-containing protein [bacterium]
MFSVILLKILKEGYFILLTIVMFISMVSFSHNVFNFDKAKQKVAQFEHTLKDLKGVIKTDSVRQHAIFKISRIIEQYNNKLNPQKKYEIANLINNMSIKYTNLDVDLICATITHESALTWQPDIISPAGAIGLMQIMPSTGLFLSKHESIRWTNEKDILFNPIYNIRLGCRYLSMLIEMYHLDGGLAAYNGGERRAAMWLASGRDNEVLLEETRDYIPAVLKLYDIFKN